MIGFIGVGNMGGAIVSSVIKNGIVPPEEICLCDSSREKCERFPGTVFCASPRDLAGKCDIVFLAVKPAQISDALTSLASSPDFDLGEIVTVTIAAGISIQYIKRVLGEKAAVVRVMPNTPLLVGEGVSALSRGDGVPDEKFDLVFRIFSASGKAFLLPEEKMNAVISLTSSSPAYLFLLAEAMCAGAANQGFDKDEAAELCACVFKGAAEMILKSGMTPTALREMVTSPGGTTKAALDVFSSYSFEKAVDEAMKACTRRAEELAKD